MQCAYNLTPRRVRVTVVAVVKQQVLHILSVCVCVCVCVCGLRYRRITICGPSGSTILFYIISETAGFSKKKMLLNVKCVF